MALTVSPAVKIFALVAVLATVVLAGGMFLMAPSEDASLDTPLVPLKKQEVVPVSAPKLAKKKEAAAAKPAAKGKAKPAAKPVPKPVAKPAAKPKPQPVVAKNGLPSVLVAALAQHQVVVVSLFDDGAKVDPLARDEAEAGAKLAKAGFVALDVTKDQKAAEALLVKLGVVLRAPAILVYSRPDVLAIQLDGFRDRDTVAQAAQNALR